MNDAETIKILEERIRFQEEGSTVSVELTRSEALTILAILKRPDERLMGRVFHALDAAERDRRMQIGREAKKEREKE